MSTYDERSREYLGGTLPTLGVRIAASADATETAAGQLLVLTLVNMTSRVHPAVELDIEDQPLVVAVPGVTTAASLVEAALELARAARPDIVVAMAANRADIPAIGVGAYAKAHRYVGARGWTGLTAARAIALGVGPADVIGGGLAAVMAAAWALRETLGLASLPEMAVSLWTLRETPERTGPSSPGILDFDDTLMVGAGAVASALVWWARLWGHCGTFDVVDKDLAEPGNLNRTLTLFAGDAGLDATLPLHKAVSLANAMPGATPVVEWWHEHASHLDDAPRLVLALANDHGFRAQVGSWGHPTVLHATTSRQWTAELHRHLRNATDDDCISCRFPSQAPPTFDCSAGALSPEAPRGTDAALPFLSGAAGLMLAAAMLQLQHGNLADRAGNHWQLAFEPRRTMVEALRHRCTVRCAAPPAEIVRRYFGAAS